MKKNFEISVIESGKAIISTVSKQMRDGDKEYRSISGVLKDIQRSNLLKAGYRDVFAAVGLDVDAEKLTPAKFFGLVHPSLHGTDKKGNDFVGVWGTRTDKETGMTEPVLRKVTSWTPRKVFMVLAQSIAAAK